MRAAPKQLGAFLEKNRSGHCEDLLQWEDGSIAAGLRRLGKGLVFNLGSNSAVLPGQILQWLNVKKVPIESSDKTVMTRHFVSNNGLYDIWVMWNTKGEPTASTFTFRDGHKPVRCREVNTGRDIPVDSDAKAAKLSHLTFESWQTRAFLSPRGQIGQAAADWFTLQRSWWSGVADPGKPLPPYRSKLSLDLTDDWAYKVMDGAGTATPSEDVSLADPKLDDSSWKRMRIGVFNLPDNTDARHIIFRKSFRVPQNWDHGRVLLFAHSDVMGAWRRYLDGSPLRVTATDDVLGGALKPGSTHTLAIEMWGPTVPAGTPAPVFISYRPDPVARQAVNDNWSCAADRLSYGASSSLPLATTDGGTARTLVKIDARESARNVVVHVQAGIDGVIFNGRWLSGFSNIYNYVDLNVTPWVRFGQENELIVVFHEKITIPSAALEFYDKSVYP